MEVFLAASLEEYFPRFNEILAGTDILWTKPSEMTFFSALGLPLILSQPVGVHERYNRRWAIENGPGLKQRDPLHAEYWLREWLNEGTLAAAAWYGFLRMPKFGLYQILERVGGEPGPEPRALPWAKGARAFGPSTPAGICLRPNGPPFLSPGQRPGFGGALLGTFGFGATQRSAPGPPPRRSRSARPRKTGSTSPLPRR